MLRAELGNALKERMRARDERAVSTIRLIIAAINDRDIAVRGEGNSQPIDDGEIFQLLQKMIKQRQESAKMYEDGGRPELANAEKAEIVLIQQFLPEQLSRDDIEKAITEAIAQTNAASIKDMGKVMAHLKEQHAGQMDFSAASQMVKAALMG